MAERAGPYAGSDRCDFLCSAGINAGGFLVESDGESEIEVERGHGKGKARAREVIERALAGFFDGPIKLPKEKVSKPIALVNDGLISFNMKVLEMKVGG